MKLLKLLIALVVLLLVAVGVLGFFVDDLAKTAIQDGGTRALGARTSLEDVDIGLLGGTATLEGLRVASPDGYGDVPFLELGRGSVAVSAGSLLSDTIRVPELRLSTVRVNLVQALKGSNYGTLLDNLRRFQGEDAGASEEAGRRFVIDTLVVEDVVVTAAPVKELGLAEVTVPIDRIELKGVGSDADRGVLLSELSGIVVEAILKRASATGRLPSAVQGALGGKLAGLRGLQDAGAELLRGLTGPGDGSQDVRNRLDDATKGVQDKLRGLIGK